MFLEEFWFSISKILFLKALTTGGFYGRRFLFLSIVTEYSTGSSKTMKRGFAVSQLLFQRSFSDLCFREILMLEVRNEKTKNINTIVNFNTMNILVAVLELAVMFMMGHEAISTVSLFFFHDLSISTALQLKELLVCLS